MPSRRRIDFNVLEGGVGLVRDASRRRAVAPAEDVHGLVHLGGLVANLCEALAARGRGETDVGVAVRVQNLRHVSVFHGDLEDVAVHVVDEDLNLPGELLDDVVIDVKRQEQQTKVATGVVQLSAKSITTFSIGGEPDLMRALQVLDCQP